MSISKSGDRAGVSFLQRAMQRASTLALLHLGGLVIAGASVAGAQEVDAPDPGTSVLNPGSGEEERVLLAIGDSVLTDGDRLILFRTGIGDTITDPDDPDATVTIASVERNSVTDAVERVIFEDGRSFAVVRDVSAQLRVDPTWPDAPDISLRPPLAAATGNAGRINSPVTGGNGAAGADQILVSIIPPRLFEPPRNGGTGKSPSERTIGVNGDRQATSGVAVYYLATGGNGGSGGDLNAAIFGDAANGGTGGVGGIQSITLNSTASITTTGTEHHAFQVRGKGGNGGRGGNAVALVDANGGTGGRGGQGGYARAINRGEIATRGTGAIGLLAQSFGGEAGPGGVGGSLIVADAGGGAGGGNGGTAIAQNFGTLYTFGSGAHGILAQSIGGNGSSSGTAGGLVALGGQAGSGGNGGSATANAAAGGLIVTHGSNAAGAVAQSIGGGGGSGGAGGGIVTIGSQGAGGGSGGTASTVISNTSTIFTTGYGAHGMLSQSIGGGGGHGGAGGGIVAIGSTGSGGGNGGEANATSQAGSLIYTQGQFAAGIAAQSIGGGGGASGASGGLVAIGGRSGGGGRGSTVSVTIDGDIVTEGTDARGVLAQSIGGGGGIGSPTGGLVAIGGRGGGGGAGGTVTVTQNGGVFTSGYGADGILAQSIGGGGGASGASGGAVSVGGTSSGGGGNGSTVNVTNTGIIYTTGNIARGVLAQSIGGGGGAGGHSGGLVSVGGSASRAGNGGNVNLTNRGDIITTGHGSIAMIGQSIGGGGGDGGTTGGVFFTLGGGGGGGGRSNTVTVTNARNLLTLGQFAHGILAQSIGGGGGNGGGAANLSAFAGVGIGGSGGAGGIGGTVDLNFEAFDVELEGQTVTVNPIIETRGDFASGFVAQSVGGGGGNGGFAVQATAGAFGAVSVGVGGRGGSGGNGGFVDIDGDVTIITRGEIATGMVAQSVGGGGGNGGFAVSAAIAGGPAAGSLSVGVGGRGGSGSTGGTVDLDSGGLIVTEGDLSTGLLAQSVGGGGGNGGFNVNLSGAGGVAGAASVAVGVGGSGGGGGNGGEVYTDYIGNVVTEGDLSTGVITQSVGGGGGNGGFNVTANVSLSPGIAGGAAVGVGGGGGTASSGRLVQTNFTGDITTLGLLSDAILVQSLGGGGGNGGFNVAGSINGSAGGAAGLAVGVGGTGGGGGSGGETRLTLDGTITTAGYDADGITVQSLGGSGGNGGVNVSGSLTGTTAGGGIAIGVGGSGGSAGGASSVTATTSGSIVTLGDEATAFLAQSLGGGGGNGGVNVAGAIGITSGAGGNLSVGVGGAGGPGGSSSLVTATVNSTVFTSGEGSSGIIAQSLGGGGGNGGVNVASNLTVSGGAGGGISIGVGGAGGGAGTGGAVNLTVGADTMTTGDGSAGILAQSLGGGGGNGAVNVAGSLTGSTGTGGSLAVGVGGAGGSGGGASTVTSTINGNVTTTGEDATAITAQSLGGGGGNGGVNVSAGVTLTGGSGGAVSVGVGGFGGAGGAGGDVNFTLDGNAIATGAGSGGVVAQSVGGGGGNGAVNVSGGLSFASASAGTLSVGVGGTGGTGNTAGAVTVDITGDIRSGSNASGLIAQSLGGGGGNGGVNVAGGINIARGAGLAIGIGGSGGSGANAGEVTVTTREGTFLGSGAFESAAFIQSLGGGGGDALVNVSGGIAMEGALAVGVGGRGGAAGTGGTVTATMNTDLGASGFFSTGLTAQSIGGGGGRGGINISGTISGVQGGAIPSLAFGLGGTGGEGAAAGDVTVNYAGNTVVDGLFAKGLVAQSIGGGGGDGGLNVAGNISGGAQNTVAGSFGIGGSGGEGGDGKAVIFNSDGIVHINTEAVGDTNRGNPFGIGVLAQSVGGGGGNGGANFSGVASLSGAAPISVSLGGSGAGGGNAGSVTVERGLNSESLILAGGSNTRGLLAQSVGGGGGTGGFNFTLNVAPNRMTRASGDVRIGGSGGDGGTAGDVTVTDAGDIVTMYANSVALTAQSIAGGGGTSSTNFNFDGLRPNADTVNLSFALGGAAGDGGTAGNVTVNHSGRIDTYGKDSTGLLVQSIAGGGGSIGGNYDYGIGGGSSLSVALGRIGGSGGTAGTVAVNASGGVYTQGDGAYGILAQSIAGGGGNSSTTSVSGSTETGEGEGAVSLNGEYSQGLIGGEGGTSNTVTVRQDGLVRTDGRDASGVLAQSIGGGGGAGGSANIDVVQQILSLPTSSTDSIGLAVQRGGEGGTGGAAGFVDVANSGGIYTFGDRSHGLNAMSIGGGGGEGGSVTNLALGGKGTNFQGEVGLGGKGGTGGTGGNVLAVNTGAIQTSGFESHGIRAQSIGGGGGDAGLVATFTGAFSSSSDQTVSATVNLGAEGGSGNTSGQVDVINGTEEDFENATILTRGDGAHGIFAEAIGGGGGDGSTVLNLAAASGGASFGSTALGLNIGGDGGTGATGGIVNVTNRGMIETQGNGAYGIYAQSVGGGGGNGGLSFAGAIMPYSPSSLTAILVTLGGSGGEGGDGEAVTVNNYGSILTHGIGSHGIYAQSVGGGGGNASLALSGTNDAAATLLSNGVSSILGAALVRPGEGGTGGTVTVNSSGDITVLGADSEAIVAQTVNGGGGGYAFDVRGIATDIFGIGFDLDDELERPVFTIGAGSQESFGLESEKVTVNITGTVQVGGARSVGESLQSVGGGGGRTAGRLDLTADEGEIDRFNLDFFLGASNGGQNHGGDIASERVGDMVVLGAGSTGLFAQSIGGGGGRTSLEATYTGEVFGDIALRLGGIGNTDDTGGDITLVRAGNAGVDGEGAYGGIVQSIGGGGGSFNLSFSEAMAEPEPVGSELAPAPASGLEKVEPAHAPAPQVSGAASPGTLQVFGEDLSADDSASMAVSLSPGQVPARPAPSLAPKAAEPLPAGERVVEAEALAPQAEGDALTGSHTAQLGADGGTGLDGGNISFELTGDTLTLADASSAYLIQSIGAGGGDIRVTGLGHLDLTMGGTGGASGDGGDILVSLNGNIETQGAASHGLVLQSVGGGGGAVLTGGAATTTTLSADNAGDGGAVSLALTGDILTTGDGATAILLQSLGGGGGLIDGVSTGSAGGTGAGGAVNLGIDGTVMAAGAGGTGLFVESAGTTGAGPITVDISEDSTVAAGAGGIAIQIAGGSDNVLTNRGMVFTADMLDGQAVLAGSGNDSFSNYGTIIGNVSLGGGLNSFMNVEGGMVYSSQAIDLGGAASQFMNAGTFDPGGTGATMVTDLTGSFAQTGTGVSLIDLDLADFSHDALNATGDVLLSGEVLVNLQNRYDLTTGRLDAPIFTGGGSVALEGAQITADSTVVLNLLGLTTTPNAINISYDISFAPEGLVGNQIGVGEYFNELRNTAATDDTLDPLWIRLIDETDFDTYADWMSQIGPELYAEQQVLALEAGESLMGDLQSCGASGLSVTTSDDRACAWVNAGAGTIERDLADAFPDTSTDRQSLTAGAHYRLGETWSVAAGIGYQTDELSGYGGRWQSDGETLSAALGLRRQSGKLGLGATLSASDASFDSQRSVDVLGPAEAISERGLTVISGTLDASWDMSRGNFSLTPYAALGVSSLSADATSETDAGLLNLELLSTDETAAWVEPGLRASWNRSGDGLGLTPYADVSVRQALSGETTTVAARLMEAPASPALMEAEADFGSTRLRGDVGLEYAFGNGARLSLGYRIDQTDTRTSDSVRLRFGLPF